MKIKLLFCSGFTVFSALFLRADTNELRVVKQWTLSYPGNPFNAESLVLARGYGYIIEKESGNAHVFRFKLSGGTDKTLEEQCKLNMNAPAAGADITADKRRLAVI